MGALVAHGRALSSLPEGFSHFERSVPAAVLHHIALPGLDDVPVPMPPGGRTPVLLHVFATWCEPCQEELPRLAALAGGPGAPTLYLVSLAETKDRVRRFRARIGLDLPIQLDSDRRLSRALGVTSLPTTIVVDETLTPRFIAEGPIDWSRADVRAWLVELQNPNPETRPPASQVDADDRSP